ncbi:MAG TPA: hypothetical protein VNQ99_16160 [Xanthobacteraceae bacterium]|nr:hypothetical protein [Xanthobacteraceae bacterium]
MLGALIEMRAELHVRAFPTEDWLRYVRQHRLDISAIGRCASLLGVTRCEFLDNGRFDFSDSGELSAVIEVFDIDLETVIDLVAWPCSDPVRFATAFGIAAGLGIDQVTNPASFFLGKPLAVHHTPLSWLQAGGQGVVILDDRSAPRWLGEALGRLAAEDLEHGRRLARVLHGYLDLRRILAPVQEAA